MDIIEFTKEEKEQIDKNMRRAIELAKQAHLNGNRFNACVLVDPNLKNKVLQEGQDNTQNQIASVSHCVIEAINHFGKCNKKGKNWVYFC